MAMPDSRLEIVEDEFLVSINHYDEFHVNLLFDHSIYRPMCTHMGYCYKLPRQFQILSLQIL